MEKAYKEDCGRNETVYITNFTLMLPLVSTTPFILSKPTKNPWLGQLVELTTKGNI